MADEIRQVIGIDVTQAIAAVNALQAKLTSLGTQMSTLAKQMSAFNRAAQGAFNLGTANKNLSQTTKILDQFGRPIGAIERVATATAKVGTSAQVASQKISLLGRARGIFTNIGRFAQGAAANVQRLTISFQTFARIVSTQLIIRSLASIQRALFDAVAAARDFQLTISEIQTISQNSFGTFENAARAVRELSDSFNLPLGEAGEGLYQVISNQIEGAANQIDVLRESAILAKVGVAEFSDTVGLITGTINAFQLAQSDAARVSSVFFETVRLGRTRIEELNNSFGTVAPLASEAGIRFEELAGAFATLTINGVDTAKAATQLRGVINAFLKPTTDLKEVLEEAGFASGEVALESLGLAGALQVLQDASGGSAAELAKLVPRVRGLAGAQVLARNAGQGLIDNIKAIDEAGQDLSAQKFQIRLETDAEVVERQINRLSNALTVDLGQSILASVRGFFELTNAGDLTLIVVKALVPVIGGLAVALAAYTAVALTAAVANSKLAASFAAVFTAANRSFAGVTGAIGLVAAAGVGAAFAIDEAANEAARLAIEGVERQVDAARAKQLFEARQQRAKELAIEKGGIRERQQALQSSIAGIRTVLAQRTRVFEEENDKILKDTETTLQSILSVNQRLLSNLSQERTQATNAAVAAEKRIGDAQAALADDQFQFQNQRFTGIQQAVNLEQRAANLGRQAANALARARTDEQIQAAQALAQRAQGFQQEAAAAASQSGNLRLINNIQQSNVSLQQDLIRGEQAQVALQTRRAAELKAIEQTEKNRVAALTEAVQKAGDLSQKLKLGGDDVVDREAVLRELNQTLGTVRRLQIPASGKLQASDIISFEKFRQDLLDSTTQLQGANIDVGAILSGASFANFETRFAAAVRDATEQGLRLAAEAGIPRATLRDAAAATTTDAPFAGIDTLVTGINDFTAEQLRIADDAEKMARAAEDMATATEKAAAIQERNQTTAEFTRESIAFLPRAIAELTEVVTRATGIGGAENILTASEAQPIIVDFQDEITNLQSRLQGQTVETANRTLLDFNERYTAFTNRLGVSARIALEAQLTRAAAQIRVVNEEIQKAAQQGTLLTTGAVTAVEQTGNAAKTNLQEANTATQGLATSSTTTATNLSSSATSAERIANALNSIRAPQVPTPPPAANGSAAGRFFPRYLANGGFASRGTDTIPAMLSPGEFVVNARSSKRFFSQLQAMNAGVQPVFRQEGGPVTNVGDINVTVNSGGSAASDGRIVARSIRRELRRGTSSL